MNRFIRLALLITLLMVLPASSVFASSLVGRVPGRVILVLAPETFPKVTATEKGVVTGLPRLDKVAAGLGASAMDRLYESAAEPAKSGEPDLRLHWTIDFDPESDLDAALAAFAALPEVERAFPVDICRNFSLPNDPLLSNQWYLRNTAADGRDIRALGGWAESEGDTNIIVAIVDSGVDWRHPDLGGTAPDYIDGSIWINWEEWNGVTGVDDDGNGKKDDYRGWDFVTGVDGWPDEDDSLADNDPMDYESHGTNCAGCVSAITDNGIGVAGTARRCKVMAVRVGWLPNNETQGVVRMDFASQGMIYAAANGASVVNCSWGSTDYLSYAVDYCAARDVIVVTAAGNDNDQVASFLCEDPDVIAVAATDISDAKTSFSSYGTWVEISAPGEGIYTTAWNQATGEHIYNSVNGTSFSSPITCGSAALIWSAHPDWTGDQVIALLLSSADSIDDRNPLYVNKMGSGRINLLRALGDNFHQVPDELPTPLDALNSASEGDTVAIASTYAISGPLSIPNKEIYVSGSWSPGFGGRDLESGMTVIQAGPGTVAINFLTGVGAATVVDGFRCTGGGGQSFSGIPVFGKYGGGIIVNRSSPTLRNLEITANSVGGETEFGGGGGILLFESDSICENLYIHDNNAVRGGGVYIYGGSPVLNDCEIVDNTLIGTNFTYKSQGGGLLALDSSVTMDGCVVSGNAPADKGGGVYAGGDLSVTDLMLRDTAVDSNQAVSSGGGLFMDGGSLDMLRGGMTGNGPAAGATTFYGGGGYLANAAVAIDSITVAANTAAATGGLYVTDPAGISLTNSLFHHNEGSIYIGALCIKNAGGELIGNTFVDNHGVNGAAGAYMDTSPLTVANNISAFNTGGVSLGNGFSVAGSVPVFTCNNVFGVDGDAYTGIDDPTGTAGNIALDPYFCSVEDEFYALLDGSPCQDILSGGCGLIGALGVGCVPVGVGDDVPGPAPLTFRVEPNYPNPFNPKTIIRFSLPEPGRTTVKIFDIAGRLVQTLADEQMTAAVHSVTWRGDDALGRPVASGVYFYRVESGKFMHAARMALIR